MPLYNITAIARPTRSGTELHTLLNKLSLLVLEKKGVVAGIKNWGEQDLAYTMRSRKEYHSRGHFVQLRYVVSPETLRELERTMKLDERVLRFMTIKEKNTSIASLGSLDPATLSEAARLMMANFDESEAAPTLDELQDAPPSAADGK
mmetsp:Transcript_18632/g.29031  ORF Transcript_18632/g.29031 Transcript_18632/m.29031 type:complete len:148 (+) Transcript_18632:706-1149(+)